MIDLKYFSICGDNDYCRLCTNASAVDILYFKKKFPFFIVFISRVSFSAARSRRSECYLCGNIPFESQIALVKLQLGSRHTWVTSIELKCAIIKCKISLILRLKHMFCKILILVKKIITEVIEIILLN